MLLPGGIQGYLRRQLQVREVCKKTMTLLTSTCCGQRAQRGRIHLGGMLMRCPWVSSGCACRRLLHSGQPPAVAAAALDLLEAALPCTAPESGPGPGTRHSSLDGSPSGPPDAAACARALLGRMLAGLSRAAGQAGGVGSGSGSEAGYRGWAAGGAGLRLYLRAAALLARLASHSREAFDEARSRLASILRAGSVACFAE